MPTSQQYTQLPTKVSSFFSRSTPESAKPKGLIKGISRDVVEMTPAEIRELHARFTDISPMLQSHQSAFCIIDNLLC